LNASAETGARQLLKAARKQRRLLRRRQRLQVLKKALEVSVAQTRRLICRRLLLRERLQFAEQFVEVVLIHQMLKKRAGGANLWVVAPRIDGASLANCSPKLNVSRKLSNVCSGN
tara:strand:- start:823 stop:1167 length:345 start_codon:yes stop_codon:yes gene_type:complete